MAAGVIPGAYHRGLLPRQARLANLRKYNTICRAGRSSAPHTELGQRDPLSTICPPAGLTAWFVSSCKCNYHTKRRRCKPNFGGKGIYDSTRDLVGMSFENTVRRAIPFLAILTALPGFSQSDPSRLRPLPAVSSGLKSGPEVGQRVPDFRLADQTGAVRDLASLRGKNGLLLAFVRSADW